MLIEIYTSGGDLLFHSCCHDVAARKMPHIGSVGPDKLIYGVLSARV